MYITLILSGVGLDFVQVGGKFGNVSFTMLKLIFECISYVVIFIDVCCTCSRTGVGTTRGIIWMEIGRITMTNGARRSL